ncbi:putative short-chain dehydrogenase [Actinoplanes missouriensis 431]|uniref:Putative short-chain dehydrogenase n=1 Tax=Actinoplanes missouriensis (strain ATCC 14538 / DSM 43046 / CBS 188.64 / JCM 3121 / NBRC 102363 / NCIMB 12654 / NRRL B-3342 / UNCC 431) TaxID=512565 RepID=I0H1T9_ACTM4|nr:SDR family NAD(P)-dependent oxidoreductase [Actinoplanes missouriensis]BAL86976.1 putative short-chain dehydrogenase [Actinoplanes missouriensis 431]
MALTAGSTVGEWLDHPEGGPAIRALLGQGGDFDESRLAPARGLPLQQLVALSQGQIPQEAVDQLVMAVNGGFAPAEESSGAWREQVTGGRFDGKTVIVTGAASGIGRATASRIVREGGRVIAVDITADKLKALVDDLGDAVVPVAGDITVDADIARIVEAAGDTIDGLANVAGIVDDFSPIHETADAIWDRVFAVNVDGVFKLTRAVIPSMLAAKRGSIVNVASEAALRGSAAGVAYTASKHAVVGITKNTAFMYGADGIRVNAVAPGGVATGMVPRDQSEFGMARTGPLIRTIPGVAMPEHLAASITFLLSDDGINLNGVILPSDGGWSVQ